MDTLVLIGTVTLGTPLIAGAIMAIGAALEPEDAAEDTMSATSDRGSSRLQHRDGEAPDGPQVP